MIRYTKGNLLESNAEALVNTVNTVGVMGKGVALMFKERFTENYDLYKKACKGKEVQTGKMFITKVSELGDSRWIVNFPTKQHWKASSKMVWIEDGLKDLRNFLVQNQIRSIALPPLGAGNGGLEWALVREKIEDSLNDLETEIIVYEPTSKYQNVAKKSGVKKLTPARALITELIRRYWILGMECSLLEIQKLAWFLERNIENSPSLENPLKLKFVAHKYGPYTNKLEHLLDHLDGSYLHCDIRIKDATPYDVIWFDGKKESYLKTYINTEAKQYADVLERTATLIDGFESPFGMELLASVDWLLTNEDVSPTIEDVRKGFLKWPKAAGKRKNKLFDDDSIQIALDRLTSQETHQAALN